MFSLKDDPATRMIVDRHAIPLDARLSLSFQILRYFRYENEPRVILYYVINFHSVNSCIVAGSNEWRNDIETFRE